MVDWRDHLAFGAAHENRGVLTFMISSEDRRSLVDYENAATGTAETDLEESVSRIVSTGCNVYAANLTSDDLGALGLNVCRVLVPGYQPLFAGHRHRALGSERLYEVPQKLGYRGIARTSTGNPAPHPFA